MIIAVIENLGLKPRRSTTALLLNIRTFTKYMLECETWKKPIRFDFTPHPNKKIAPVAAAGVEDRSFSLWLRLLGCFASPALPSAGAENMEYYFVNSQTMNRFVKKSNLPVLRIRIQKNCQKALKNMVLGSGIRDPGSEKNLFRIPDPGVKKEPYPGSGSALNQSGSG